MRIERTAGVKGAIIAVLLGVPLGPPPGAQVVRPALAEAPARVFRLIVVPEVLDELARLADTARVETARCLVGVMRGDSAVVDLLWTPRIEASNDTSVRYQSCPLATIAEWHNHPWSRDRAPEDLCYLSPTDVTDGLRRRSAPIQMVQVTAEVLCWWGRAQISMDDPVLWPPAGQRTGPGGLAARTRGGNAQVARFEPTPRD